MFPRASTAKILPAYYDVPLAGFSGKLSVKSLEQVGNNFSSCELLIIGKVSCKHLVGVEVIRIAVIPYALCIPVLSALW
jgi:hypothetical protein